MRKPIQSLLLMLGGVIVYFAREWNANDAAPITVVREMLAACQFAPPNKVRVRTSPGRSTRWCLNGDGKDTIALMNHMKVNADGYAIVCAADFGSMTQVAYYPPHDLFLINPRVLHVSSEMIECYENIAGVTTTTKRHAEVTATFINAEFRPDSRTFFRSESCIIQALIHSY